MLTRQRDENPIAKVLIIRNYIPFVKGKRYRKNSKDEQILRQEAKMIQGHNCKITLSTTKRFNSPNKNKFIIFKKTTVLDDKNSKFINQPGIFESIRLLSCGNNFADPRIIGFSQISLQLCRIICLHVYYIFDDVQLPFSSCRIPNTYPLFFLASCSTTCLSSSNKLRFLFVVKDLVPVGRPCHVQITAFVEGEAIA